MKRKRKKLSDNQFRDPRQVYIVSLGCAKNLVDTEVMCGKLATSGFILTNQVEAADVMLINTCSFIGDAREESAQAIEEGIVWRAESRNRRLLVAGCWPQQAREELKNRFPKIDQLLGLDEVPAIAEHLTSLYGRPAFEAGKTNSLPSYLYDHTEPRLQLTPGNFAYVKIAEGCNHKCRFCTIPAIRGRLRSRSPDSVLEECRMLLKNGVREINFIGQDVTAYGHDRGNKKDLLHLIEQCGQFEEKFWLRLLYTHPLHITEDLLDLYNEEKSPLLPYLDMPLQHIDDTILRRMGRGMGETATRSLLNRIREIKPRVSIRTTFMVGYPGETEEAFNKLFHFIQEYRFEHLGVFSYSPEAATPAATDPEPLPEKVVTEERKAILMTEQQRISKERNRQRIGSVLPVLVEGIEENGLWQGRAAGDAPEVDGSIQFSGPRDCLETGIVNVRITDADAYDLKGKVTEENNEAE